MAAETEVLDAPGTVVDPKLGLDVVSRGLVYAIGTPRSEVRVIHPLTPPGCPLGEPVAARIEEEVSARSGVQQVVAVLVFSPPWGRERIREDARLAARL